MTEHEHSPLPWHAIRDGLCIVDATTSLVIVAGRTANVAIILERVNGWDALVKERDELRAFVRWLAAPDADGVVEYIDPGEIQDKARTLLARKP